MSSSPEFSELKEQSSFLSTSESKALAKLQEENKKLKRDISNLSFIREGSEESYLENKMK